METGPAGRSMYEASDDRYDRMIYDRRFGIVRVDFAP